MATQDRLLEIAEARPKEGGFEALDGLLKNTLDRIDKLFTPFSTTKKSGMGMGLSISQAIVRAHGGNIGFRNNDAGGATFSFTLPAATRENVDGRKANSLRR